VVADWKKYQPANANTTVMAIAAAIRGRLRRRGAIIRAGATVELDCLVVAVVIA
jgi:hypothetical protein